MKQSNGGGKVGSSTGNGLRPHKSNLSRKHSNESEKSGRNSSSESTVSVSPVLHHTHSRSCALGSKFYPKGFQARYQRNNKRGGLKNLRCFPHCGPQHKERGFCGRPVIVELSPGQTAEESSAALSKPLLCWAQFVPSSENVGVEAGTVLPLDLIMSIERSRENALLPWIRGKQLRPDEVPGLLLEGEATALSDTHRYFGFNVDMKGWHYGWASNKHSCNAEHCIQVHVFQYSHSDPGSSSTIEQIKDRILQIGSPLPVKGKGSSPLSATEANNVLDQSSNEEDEYAPGESSHDTGSNKSALPGTEVLQALDLQATDISKVFLECKAVVRSPSFQLFCRRRRRFQLEPTAPVAARKDTQKKKTSFPTVQQVFSLPSVALVGGSSANEEFAVPGSNTSASTKAALEKKILEQIKQLKQMHKQIKSEAVVDGSTSSVSSSQQNRKRGKLGRGRQNTDRLPSHPREELDAQDRFGRNRERSLSSPVGLMQLVHAAAKQAAEGSGDLESLGNGSASSSGASSPTSKKQRSLSETFETTAHQAQAQTSPSPTVKSDEDAIGLLLGFSGKFE